MAKPVVKQYAADEGKAIKAITAVIARLGFTLKGVDQTNGVVTFETGISLSSWAGQSMSAHVMDVGNAVQITIGGTMKSHGAQMQVYDWGEASQIAGKVFAQLDALLGSGRWVRVSRPVSSASKRIEAVLALILALVVVFFLVVLFLRGR